jgi:hypothetical protein
LESLPEMPQEQQVIHVEIHAEQRHKNRNDNLVVGAVGGDAVVFYGKPAGAGGTIRRRLRRRTAAFCREAEV